MTATETTSEEVEPVVCGFVEEVDEPLDAFMSKAGGKPIWLKPRGLPSVESLQCVNCRVAMTFMLQLYAPLEEFSSRAHHRVLSLFCCRGCATFKVFRCQSTEEQLTSTGASDAVCDVCGCLGPKQCSKCHVARYCSEHHQKLAWASGHSANCQRVAAKDWLFKEHEIVTVEEDDADYRPSPLNPGSSTATSSSSQIDKSLIEEETAEEQEEEEESQQQQVDKVFARFQKRIKRCGEDQVLRYQWRGSPLWFHSCGVLETLQTGENAGSSQGVPRCERCGSERVFEFQVLPQLLYFLGVSGDSNLDFGTLVVFSCSKSCPITTEPDCNYTQEYVYVQQVPVVPPQ